MDTAANLKAPLFDEPMSMDQILPQDTPGASLEDSQKADEHFLLKNEPSSGYYPDLANVAQIDISVQQTDKPDRTMPEKFEFAKKILTPVTESPLAKTAWPGEWFFTWVNKIFNMAMQNKILKNSDLYKVSSSSGSIELEKKFLKLKKDKKIDDDYEEVSLAIKMFDDLRRKGMYYFILVNILEFSLPLVVRMFYTKEADVPRPFGLEVHIMYKLVFSLVILVLFLRYLFLNQAIFNFRNAGRCTSVLRPRVITKLLTMQASSVEKYSEITLINMLTNEMDSLSAGLTIVPDFINSFFFIGFGFYYLYKESTQVILIILGLLLVAIGFYQCIFARTTKYRQMMLDMNDEKSKIMRNILRDIKFIKTHRMEKFFYEKVIRHQLVQNLLIKKLQAWEQIATVITFYLPTLFAFVIFGYSLFQKKSLHDEESSYLVLTVLSIIKNPIKSISEGFRKYPHYRTAHKRIAKFLAEKSRKVQDSSSLIPVGSFGRPI